MTKDELVFCINCIRSVYPGIWSDTPDKVKNLINDVYDVDVELKQVEELYDERILEQDEYDLIFKNNGYY
jgi:hypothetical protein